MTNKYELAMIFSVAGGEEATNALIEKFKALVESQEKRASAVSIDVD